MSIVSGKILRTWSILVFLLVPGTAETFSADAQDITTVQQLPEVAHEKRSEFSEKGNEMSHSTVTRKPHSSTQPRDALMITTAPQLPYPVGKSSPAILEKGNGTSHSTVTRKPHSSTQPRSNLSRTTTIKTGDQCIRFWVMRNTIMLSFAVSLGTLSLILAVVLIWTINKKRRSSRTGPTVENVEQPVCADPNKELPVISM